jgi:RimJ/RimL family protein N-acetyltransferase
MPEHSLSVREMQQLDIKLIIQYWFGSESSYLKAMGVDLTKLPSREQFCQLLSEQINTPIEKRNSYCVIWQVDGAPVGHSNTNPTVFGKDAYMHLHIWNMNARRKGFGTELLRMTLPYFFEKLQLKSLYCQPYAMNPAPNNTLQKLGFDFIKEYVTIPGPLNFEQPVKLWEMSIEKFKELNK